MEVPPLSRKRIREAARRVREVLDIRTAYFPIVEVLDVVLPGLDDEFVLEVRTGEEMGENHGLTVPEQHLIQVREDIYLGAVRGVGRDRLTLAHELGHYILHHQAQIGLARRIAGPHIPAYRSSEWQANAFGGELLVSCDHVSDCGSPAEIARRFGVSLEAADVQWRIFKKEGLL